MNQNQNQYIQLVQDMMIENFKQNDKLIVNLIKLDNRALEKIKTKLANFIFENLGQNGNIKANRKTWNRFHSEMEKIMLEELRFGTDVQIEEVKTSWQGVQGDIKGFIDYELAGHFSLDNAENMETFTRIINEKIDKTVWSKRLWANKSETMNQLKNLLVKMEKGVINIDQARKEFDRVSNQTRYRTRRLFNNEFARVQDSTLKLAEKENGIEYQLFIATLDNKTSDICQELDGQVFEIEKSPNIPGDTHVNCRSCLTGIVSKDWRPQTRVVNDKSSEIIDYKTWKEIKEDLA